MILLNLIKTNTNNFWKYLNNWMTMEDMITKSLRQKTKKYSDMKLYKMLYHKINLKTCVILVIGSIISLLSCNRDIDSKIKDSYNSNDTIINLSDLYPEEWDSVYFFGNCSLGEISKRLGISVENMSLDFGERIFLVNKRKVIIYYKEWLPNYGQEIKGALFQFKKDSMIIAIPREKANFIIRKRDEKSFWVIHQE